MSPAKGALLDFNKAYLERHGRIQRHVERRRAEVKVEAIMAAAGGAIRNIRAVIDLESSGCGPEIRNVCEGDAIVAKAAHALFSVVFISLDEKGSLSCMIFNNGRYEGERMIAEGETKEFCCVDFSPFMIRVRRLQLHVDSEGVLGCVEISARQIHQPAY